MSDAKPKAREGLLTHDHSKRGRRYVSILDPLHGRVTLLEPWEHAILVLCDGEHTARQILAALDAPIEGETVDLRLINRALKYFEAQDLIEPIGLNESPSQVIGPRTLAQIQQAYREWHKDPVKTGQILSGIYPSPFTDPMKEKLPVGLEPTVALPEDDEKAGSPPPVAIGTTLVVGDANGEPDGRSIKSLLNDDAPPLAAKKPQRTDEPETLVGSLSGTEAVIAESEFEEDELELGGKLSELLAAVDNDFAEVEKREKAAKEKTKDKPKKAPPPIGKPIAGIAEVPRAKSVAKPENKIWLAEVEEKPPTRVMIEPDSVTPPPQRKPRIPRAPTLPPTPTDMEISVTDEPTMKSIPYGEMMLRPTMVGLPPPDEKSAPILLAPPRTSSKAGDWVGAVVAAEPTPEQRNVSTRSPARPTPLEGGATIEDTLPYLEAATEGRIHAHDPRDTSGDARNITTDRVEEPPTNPAATEHIAPGRAREVFERLRKAGLKARSYSDDSLDQSGAEDHPARRKDEKAARRFEQALISLTAGDLELALAHFRALHDQMPNSKRVRGFIEAIESVRDEQAFAPSILEDFEAALEDAIAYGRCPKCFSMMAPDEAECFACGFRLSRTI